ncbi:SIT4 phosphatase-associated protein-domain-containing protein [Fennellomyces sp. T-0311]|nr:SIT4 phosphatase-associated protein-domain-containing protein [Fennellomyces sp. T-0311]
MRMTQTRCNTWIQCFCKPENLTKLLNYITATDLDESRRFKYPFLACEIMACEIPQIVDSIVLDNKGMLESFWEFLNRPAPVRRRANEPTTEKKDNDEEEEEEDVGLDSLQAQYFCKTISVFLTKRTGEVLDFIKSKPDHLKQILAHLQTSAIMDLLLTLVRVEELAEGKGIVQWLSDHGLLDNLVDRLDPYLDSEEHSVAQQCICEIIRMSQTSLVESPSIGLNDLIIDLKSERVIRKLANFMLDAKAPNSTSTLINGVTIIIDLIRHNNSDMDNDPMLNGAYGYNANAVIRHTSVSLADMLKVLADHVGDFNDLLVHPRSVNGPMRTTLGEQVPLGFERLKICELFAELLHCSNMSNLNSNTLEEDEADQEKNDDDASSTQEVPKEEKPKEETKSDAKANSPSPKEAAGSADDEKKEDLSIGDYLKVQFVEHRVMPTCIDLFFTFPWNNFLHYVIYDMLHQVFNGRMDKGYNRHLAISVFKDGKLTDRMVQAQKANDEECAKPKGMRLGYMGHLTFIADEIIKLFEGYPEAIAGMIKHDVDMDRWNAYCNAELKETKERDRLPLAGPRPNDGMDGAATDEEEEEEPLEGATAGQVLKKKL